MTGWAAGYVTEVGYTHGYYAALNPHLIRQALLSRGIDCRWSKRLRYLELGFGQGLSLNIHAAANPDAEFWGCDFMPAQAAQAQALAAASGANVRILDDSFEQLLARTDLPSFDFIVLHGIWSWVSQPNRHWIIEILRRHLAVGGVVYMSYNTTPGWAPSIPIWHLISLHANLVSGGGLPVEVKVTAALDFVQSLVDAGAAFFRFNPAAVEKLKVIRSQHPAYVAHEFFTPHFQPMSFVEVNRALSGAKLSYAASANLLDHLDAINLTPDHRNVLQSQSHPVLRESMRDYLLNQGFRHDLWVKGMRLMAPSLRLERFLSQAYAVAAAPEVIPLKVRGKLGELPLREELYGPLLAALAADAYVPKTLAQLSTRLPVVQVQTLLEAIVALCGTGFVMPVQPAQAAAAARSACDRLNAYLMEQAALSGDMPFLASPLAGGGISVSRIEQMFLRARKAGRQSHDEWAREACRLLWVQGQRLAKDGRSLETEQEALVELIQQASEFEARRLPILQALQVA